MAKWWKRAGRKVSRVARRVAKSDIVQKAVATGVTTLVPGGGAIVTGYKAARKTRSLLRSPGRAAVASGAAGGAAGALIGRAATRRRSVGTPRTGGTRMAGLPQMPALLGKRGGPGLLPRGPGGKLQWPWQDPNIPKMLEQFACDDAYLSTAYRAPKGFVVWRNEAGRPFGLWKPVARLMGWKPKKRPYISAADWGALSRADRTVNKLKNVVRKAKRLKSVKSL